MLLYAVLLSNQLQMTIVGVQQAIKLSILVYDWPVTGFGGKWRAQGAGAAFIKLVIN